MASVTNTSKQTIDMCIRVCRCLSCGIGCSSVEYDGILAYIQAFNSITLSFNQIHLLRIGRSIDLTGMQNNARSIEEVMEESLEGGRHGININQLKVFRVTNHALGCLYQQLPLVSNALQPLHC
ncbi:hypothetical protein ABKN59_007299 [Abortiporus biennis]